MLFVHACYNYIYSLFIYSMISATYMIRYVLEKFLESQYKYLNYKVLDRGDEKKANKAK